MFELDAYAGLPAADQVLHGAHFLLCGLAVIIASIPLLTEKGSEEHKFGGMLYVPVASIAFLLACVMAWIEQSLVLFCFNAFCAYLLLSGWRAMHEKDAPALIDWLIPGGLFLLALLMVGYAVIYDGDRRSIFLAFFAVNAFYLCWRDWRHLCWRMQWGRHKIFFGEFAFQSGGDWLNRHVAGMVGSVMANLSVVVLTLLPVEWHWIWPVTLVVIAGGIALKQQAKKRHLRRVLAPVMKPKFGGRVIREDADEDIRRAA